MNLFRMGKSRDCLTNSLTKTATALCVNDSLLIYRSENNFSLVSNWFVKTFSFLKWQQEMVNVWIRNIIFFDNDISNEDDDIDIVGLRFELLTLLHSHLDHLIEYLVIFYCCFDPNLWITVFYLFYQQGIGEKQSKLVFGERKDDTNSTDNSDKLSMFSIEAIDIGNESANTIKNSKKNVLNELKGLSILISLIYGIYQEYEFEGLSKYDNLNLSINDNPFDLVTAIHLKLKSMVNNIKTQLTIQEMTGTITQANKDNKDSKENEESKQNKENTVRSELVTILQYCYVELNGITAPSDDLKSKNGKRISFSDKYSVSLAVSG